MSDPFEEMDADLSGNTQGALEAAAARFGLRKTSGLRSVAHNAAVGGAKNSYHVKGQADDFAGAPEAMKQFHEYAKTNYGDRLAEAIHGSGDHRDHVHIAWKSPQSQQSSDPFADMDRELGSKSQTATPDIFADMDKELGKTATPVVSPRPKAVKPAPSHFQEDREAEHQFELAKTEGNTTAVAHHALTLRAKGYEVGQDPDGNPYQKRPEGAPAALRLDRSASGRMRKVAAPTQPAEVPKNVVPSVQPTTRKADLRAPSLRAAQEVGADIVSTLGSQIGKYGSAAYDLMFRPAGTFLRPDTEEEKAAKARQDEINGELKDLHFKSMQADVVTPETAARVQELHQEHDAIAQQVEQERAKKGAGAPLTEASERFGEEHGLKPGIAKHLVRGAAGMAIPTAATLLTGGAAGPAVMGGLTGLESLGAGKTGIEALGSGLVSGASVAAMGGAASALDQTALGATAKLAGRALANTGIGLGAQALEGGNVVPQTDEERTAFFGQRIFDLAFALMHSPQGHGLTEEQATAKAREQVAQEVSGKPTHVEHPTLGVGEISADQRNAPRGYVKAIFDDGVEKTVRMVGGKNPAKYIADPNRAADSGVAPAETSSEVGVTPEGVQPPATIPERRAPERRVSEGEPPEGIPERRGLVRRARDWVADKVSPELAEQRTKAEKDARTDPLTGLGNQRAWEEQVKAAEADPSLSIITTDINNMKAKNAAHGHEAGHETIKQQGEALRTAAAEFGEDRVMRSGEGDEFSAIVPKDKAEAISRRAEELFKEEELPNGFKVSLSADHGNTFKEAETKLTVRKETRKGEGGSYRPDHIGTPDDFPESVVPSTKLPTHDTIRDTAIHDSEWSRLYDEVAHVEKEPSEASIAAFKERSRALGIPDEDASYILDEGADARRPPNVADQTGAGLRPREGTGGSGEGPAGERPQDAATQPVGRVPKFDPMTGEPLPPEITHHSQVQPRDESGHFDGAPEYPEGHPKASTDRATFAQALSERFHAPPHVAEATSHVVDAMANTYAKLSGGKAADFYNRIRVGGGKKGEGLQQADTQPAFYSQLTRSLESQTQGRFTPEQLEAVLKKSIKPDEMKWTGFDDFIAQKKAKGERVTKEEALGFARQNAVEVREVTKGGEHSDLSPQDVERLNELSNRTFEGKITPEEAKEYGDLLYKQDKTAPLPTKYHNYQIPGGESYRELLLTLPDTSAPIDTSKWTVSKESDGWWRVRDENGKGIHASPKSAELAMQYATRSAKRSQGDSYRSSHFDEPNVLAHIRFNERTDADGKRVLFIEEIQSDWHQEGRKKGYQQKLDPTGWTAHEIEPPDMVGNRTFEIRDANGDVLTNISATKPEIALERARSLKPAGVPDAPFKKSWHELAMKRAIRWASENGFDKVAWTTGEMQNERYDLSKQVRNINWTGGRRAGSDKIVTITPLEGNDIEFRVLPDGKVAGIGEEQTGGEFDGKHITDVVGKDIGDKIMAELGGDLSGAGLRVGGSGMTGFYDKILPEAANKLGKKFGARVGKTDIAASPTARDPYIVTENGAYYIEGGIQPRPGPWREKEQAQSALADLKAERQTTPVHALDITPEMRASAMEGQPLFQEARAMANFMKDGTGVITALNNPNESSAAHEIHHIALPSFMDLAGKLPKDVPAEGQQFVKDMGSMAQWMGLRDVAEFNDLHQKYIASELKGADLRRYVDAQEKGARGFEKYLRTGKAPTPQLKAVFDQFKEWLRSIYTKVKGSDIDVHIGAEQRAVWDRMLGGKGEAEPIEPTSIKNAVTDQERFQRGLSEISKTVQKSFPESHADGMEMVENDPSFRAQVAEWAERPKPLSDTEDAALVYDRMRLYKEHREAVDAADEAVKGGDESAIARADAHVLAIEDQINLNDTAAKRSGTENGRGLNARKMMIREDFSLANMIQRARVAAEAGGKEFTPELRAKVTEQAKQIQELQTQLEAKEKLIAEQESQAARNEKVANWRGGRKGPARPKATLDAEFNSLSAQLAKLAGGEPAGGEAEGLKQADTVRSNGLTPEVTKLIKNLARNRVEAGARTAEEVNAAVHQVVSQHFPDIEARETGDVWSEYGKSAKLSKDEINVAMREAKRQQRLLSALEDAQAGESPARSGLQRDKASKRVKELTAQVKDAMRKNGMIPEKAGTDPTKRWENALKSYKKRLTTNIAEYERRITENDFTPKQRNKLALDAEAQKLVAQRDLIKRQYQNELLKQQPGKWWRNLAGLRKSWMLSGVTTQARNIGGTGAYQMFDEVARMPGAVADVLASAVTGHRALTGPSPVAMLDSVIHMAKEGGKQAKEILKHGATAEEMKTHQFQQEIDTGFKALDVASNAVFRFMTASDRVFREQAYKRNLWDRASAQAKTEARTDKALDVKQRTKDLVNNPDPELKASAEHDALVATFNNSNTLSEAIKTGRSRLGPAANFAVDLVMPFDRTPTNVIMRVVEATPYGAAKAITLASVRKMMGKAMTLEQQRQFSQTIGRSTAGSGIMALGYVLAARGLMTGAGSDDDRKNPKFEPNSLKIGEHTVALSPISPIGNLMALGASAYSETHRDEFNAGKFLGSQLQPLGDQPLVRGMGGLGDLIHDPNRGGAKSIAGLGYSFVPFGGAVRDVGKLMDSEKRKPETKFSLTGVKEQFQANVPGWRNQLPAKGAGGFLGPQKPQRPAQPQRPRR